MVPQSFPRASRHPQDKGHAESSVSYASTWILAALRNETYFSLADAKEAVAEKLEELNGYPFKKREGNRRDAYIHEEKAFMQPLPVNPYEPSVWSDQTVLLDYTVTDGLNKYSVPYEPDRRIRQRSRNTQYSGGIFSRKPGSCPSKRGQP